MVLQGLRREKSNNPEVSMIHGRCLYKNFFDVKIK